MTKDELNKRWAELDQQAITRVVNGGHEDQYEEEIDWTEPNRFFGEVVPRIREISELKYGEKLELAFEYSGAIVHCSFTKWLGLGNYYQYPEGRGKSEGEAGLEAAIKAREEIGR